jgi:O-antigen ligase
MKKWITHLAFILGLIVVIARLTTPDVLRDPAEPSPGADYSAIGAGVGTGLVFDLLASLPAILVLMRAAIDKEFKLNFHLSHLLLAGLSIWMSCSVAWSADRFAALATACHWSAAACLLWAMAQLVRSPGRLRLVAAVAFGLLLVMVVQSMLFRWIDVPANIDYWNQHKDSYLASRNWTADSFAARQFEQKLTSGELVGFFNSPNSFAAAGVLLFFTCAAIGIQKVMDRESPKWLAQTVLAALALIWVLYNAKSKTSAATPFLGVAIVACGVVFRDQLRHRRKLFFAAGVGLVAFTAIALVGHGIYRHGLFPGHFSNSLDFRWKYWIASWAVFREHPWVGTGWNNFGLYYLAHRVPEAAEEIKDPHSFPVRFAVELGLIGLALSLAWIGRTAWELTATGQPLREHDEDDELLSVRWIVILSCAGILLTILATTDFSLPLADTLNLLLRPMLYLLSLVLGSIAAAMLSPHKWSLDRRPAPLLFCCGVTGLLLFLLHNLIDFSLFEPGALFAFMAIAGALQGMVSPARPARCGRATAGGLLAIGGVVWVTGAALLVVPVLAAESAAASGNEWIRTAPKDHSPAVALHYRKAADAYGEAAGFVPFNSDYIFREAKAAAIGGDFDRARAKLAETKRVNPLLIDAYLLEANLLLSMPNPDVATVRSDFERIVQLNPNDVSLRMQFGDAMLRLGETDLARQQYQSALKANDALPIGEPKRLSDEQVKQLKETIRRCR